MEFVSFTAHIFNQNGQVQFTATTDHKRIWHIGIFDTQRHVAVTLGVQTITQLARCDVGTFAARQRASVNTKGHTNGGFFDGDDWQLFGAKHIGNRVANHAIGNTGDGHDFACLDFFDFGAIKPVVDEELNDFGVGLRTIMGKTDNLLGLAQRTTAQATHHDFATIVVIKRIGNQHLG